MRQVRSVHPGCTHWRGGSVVMLVQPASGLISSGVLLWDHNYAGFASEDNTCRASSGVSAACQTCRSQGRLIWVNHGGDGWLWGQLKAWLCKETGSLSPPPIPSLTLPQPLPPQIQPSYVGLKSQSRGGGDLQHRPEGASALAHRGTWNAHKWRWRGRNALASTLPRKSEREPSLPMFVPLGQSDSVWQG